MCKTMTGVVAMVALQALVAPSNAQTRLNPMCVNAANPWACDAQYKALEQRHQREDQETRSVVNANHGPPAPGPRILIAQPALSWEPGVYLCPNLKTTLAVRDMASDSGYQNFSMSKMSPAQKEQMRLRGDEPPPLPNAEVFGCHLVPKGTKLQVVSPPGGILEVEATLPNGGTVRGVPAPNEARPPG